MNVKLFLKPLNIFTFIDYSTSQFRFTIDQNQTSNDELKNKEKIFNYLNCFEHKVKIFNKF